MQVTTEEADKYQDLFNLMFKKHKVILTIDEMNEVINEAKKISCLDGVVGSDKFWETQLGYAIHTFGETPFYAIKREFEEKHTDNAGCLSKEQIEAFKEFVLELIESLKDDE